MGGSSFLYSILRIVIYRLFKERFHIVLISVAAFADIIKTGIDQRHIIFDIFYTKLSLGAIALQKQLDLLLGF